MYRWLLLLPLWQPSHAFRLPQLNTTANVDLGAFNESWWEEWEEVSTELEMVASKMYPDGWFTARAPGKIAYFDVHIPKSAGTSWAEDVQRFVLPKGVGYHSREVCFDFPAELYEHDRIAALKHGESRLEPMRPGDRMVVMLRRPAAHVYSQFLECKYSMFGKHGQRSRPQQAGNLSSLTTWLTFFKGGDQEQDINCYHPFNMQARSLSCQSKEEFASHHYSHLQPPSLELALKNTEKAFFVGLVEHYQASLCLFFWKARPGEALPRFCNCQKKEAWASFRPRHYAHDVPPHSVKDLNRAESNLIAELTRLDDEIYRAAQRRFLREAHELLRATGTHILCDAM